MNFIVAAVTLILPLKCLSESEETYTRSLKSKYDQTLESETPIPPDAVDKHLCYSCHSKNYDNKICEKVAHFYENVPHYIGLAENCLKMVIYKINAKNITTERVLRRVGFPDDDYEYLYEEIELFQNKGFKVDFYTCKEDRCNNL